MMKHLKYLRYVLRHKYWVARMCFRRGLYWRGIMHDMSKFLPSMWSAYANYFYGFVPPTEGFGAEGYRKPTTTTDEAFDLAWLMHQKSERHHWQFWVLLEDSGAVKLIEMPRQYREEMVCDWMGASIATGRSKGFADAPENTWKWYQANKGVIQLHPSTRIKVEDMIDQMYLDERFSDLRRMNRV